MSEEQLKVKTDVPAVCEAQMACKFLIPELNSDKQ